MELINELKEATADVPEGGAVPPTAGLDFAVDEAIGTLSLLLLPFAPHLASEIWERTGRPGEAAAQPWPEADASLLVQATAQVVVQINGKLRGRVEVATTASEEDVLAAARAEPNVAAHLDGKTLRRAVHVPGKLLNLVVS
jgi:leucyl-tRNA synthetase